MNRSRPDRGRPRIGPGRGRAFAPALGLFFLSGACALAHELLWTRRLIDLLGASGASTSRVFGCFFLGLALGSAWASRRAGRGLWPWAAVAWAEVMVAVLAIPALLLPEWTGWIWPLLGPTRSTGAFGGAVKLAASAVVIVPPAFAMGAVTPLVMSATLVGPARLGRQGVWLYAANTLGGVAGVVLTALMTLPRLGAAGAMLVAMAGNALVALGFLVLQRRNPGGRPEVAQPAELAAPRANSAFAPQLLAFISGVGVLTVEVVALEMLMLVAPLSYQAPAAILASVIALLGMAALLAPGLGRWTGRGAAVLPDVMAAAGVALVVAPPLFMGVAILAGDLARDSTLAGFLFKLSSLLAVSLGPAILVAGLVFPETMAWADGQADFEGRTVGRLLAWNGLGGLCGAEAAYGLLLPNLGIYSSLAALGGLYALVGSGLALARARGHRGEVIPSGVLMRSLAAVGLVAMLGLGPMRRLPHINPFLKVTVLDERFGREGAVAVVDGPALSRAILVSNQYILGSTRGRWEQERQAHLPLLLHPAPGAAAFIGLATGMTPGAALEHPKVKLITAVELSPLVARAADRYFGDFNHGITRDRRARVVIEDGRTFIASAAGLYDVVVGDLFLPWAPGEGRLFSVEHFRDVRRSLRPGGLFCQWLPLYQLTPDQFALIAATFRRAFPEVHLIRNGFQVGQPVVGLIGCRDGALDWAGLEQRAADLRDGGLVLDPSVRHREAVALLYLGIMPPGPPDAPINTLGNLKLEIDAGRERITGNPGAKYLYGDRYVEWLHAMTASCRPAPDADEAGAAFPELRSLILSGLKLTTWDQTATRRAAGRPAPADHLPPPVADLIPPEVRADRAADWSRWPGRPPALEGGPPEATSRDLSTDPRK